MGVAHQAPPSLEYLSRWAWLSWARPRLAFTSVGVVGLGTSLRGGPLSVGVV